MVKRSSWLGIGGCKALRVGLSEDGTIGTRMDENGYRTRVVANPAVQNMPPATLGRFFERRVRWYRLRVFQHLPLCRFVAPMEFWLDHLYICLALAAETHHFTASLQTAALVFVGAAASAALYDYSVACMLDRATRTDLGKPPEHGVAGAGRWLRAWALMQVLPIFIIFKGMFLHACAGGTTIQWGCHDAEKMQRRVSSTDLIKDSRKGENSLVRRMEGSVHLVLLSLFTIPFLGLVTAVFTLISAAELRASV